MARGQSPYQGRYTVPTVDFSPIGRGGAAWGQAFKDVGQSIGAGIEKYGLKKEADKKTKGSIKNAVSIIDDMKLDEPDQNLKDQYTLQREQLLDEEIPLATRGEQARLLRETIGIRSQLKQRQALTQATTMANTFSEKTEDMRLQLEASKVENARLNTTSLNLSNTLKELTVDSTPEDIRLTQEKLRAELGLAPLRKEQLEADLAKTKAETAKLTWEVEGKPFKITPLKYTHPTTREEITDENHGYGKGNTLLYKQVQADGKTVRLHTIGTASDALDAKIKAKDYHFKAIESLEKDFAFRKTEKDPWWEPDDEYNFSIKILEMVLDRGTYSDDGKTVSHSWDSADGDEFDVEGWKSLEEMEKGNAKDKARAEKINALRRHREEMWKFPEPPAAPGPLTVPGAEDISDEEVRERIRGM